MALDTFASSEQQVKGRCVACDHTNLLAGPFPPHLLLPVAHSQRRGFPDYCLMERERERECVCVCVCAKIGREKREFVCLSLDLLITTSLHPCVCKMT